MRIMRADISRNIPSTGTAYIIRIIDNIVRSSVRCGCMRSSKSISASATVGTAKQRQIDAKIGRWGNRGKRI